MKWILLGTTVAVAIVAIVTIVGAMLPKKHVISRKGTFRQPPAVLWETISGPSNLAARCSLI